MVAYKAGGVVPEDFGLERIRRCDERNSGRRTLQIATIVPD